MKFRDIPKFTDNGTYRVDMHFDYLLKWIDNMIDKYDLQLNPDFQRGHVWTDAQQSAWLEYIIRGGSSGKTLYFNNPNWLSHENEKYRDFVCVDGLQRITAIRRFMNNEIQVFGGYLDDYEDKHALHSHDMTLELVVNDLQSKEEVLQWYIDMNSAGTQHSTEEIERVKGLLNEEKDKHMSNIEEREL